MPLTLGQDVFCDCGIDILEYTVMEVRTSAERELYVLRSKKGVGRHRFIEVMVFENKEGTIRYMELDSSEMDDNEFDLEPFTSGKYFTTIEAARNSFARTQIDLIEDDTRKLKFRVAENDRRVSRWTTMLVSGAQAPSNVQ
jgi:hypothetical protein